MILVNTLLKTQRRNLNILYKIVKRYEQTVYFKKYKVALTHVKRSSASLIIRKNWVKFASQYQSSASAWQNLKTAIQVEFWNGPSYHLGCVYPVSEYLVRIQAAQHFRSSFLQKVWESADNASTAWFPAASVGDWDEIPDAWLGPSPAQHTEIWRLDSHRTESINLILSLSDIHLNKPFEKNASCSAYEPVDILVFQYMANSNTKLEN